MTISNFRITLRHDKGKHDVTVAAQSIGAAINTVLAAECAPERAIVKIERALNRKWGANHGPVSAG